MSAEGSSEAGTGTKPRPRCNVYAGSDLGYVKGISFATKSFSNLNTVESLNKKMGISCLCWGDLDESMIYAGCKGGDVVNHDVTTGLNRFVLLDQDNQGNDHMKAICVHEDTLVTAFQKGSVFVHNIESESENSIVPSTKMDQLDTLTNINQENKDLQCLIHNKFNPHMIATGGNENPLRVWDMNNLSAGALFASKNVKHDWLNLRVPVWVTRAKFYPMSDKIITGTGHGKIRMYDPNAGQKRPVIDVKCDELEQYPITALDIRPKSDYQVIVGNTVGTLLSIDLRMKTVVKAFKGNKGAVTDIQFHAKYPVFAACSADRYVRCYDPDLKGTVLQSFYVNSSLNCILFSTPWEKEDYGRLTLGKLSDDKIEKVSKKVTHELSDEGEDDDVWNKMEVVGAKKMKVK